MKVLKVIFSVLVVFMVFSCAKDDELGLEQYYENRDAGISFLAENKSRDEVTETETGLQYEVIESGDSGVGTWLYDTVKIKFSLSSIDGDVQLSNLDDEVDDITYAQVNAFIFGMREGLQLMNVGDVYKFYIPYELAFGENFIGDLEPLSAVICEVHLIENFFENPLDEDIHVTGSGLQYKIIEEGTGEYALSNSDVKVDYHGTFLNGVVFDSSVVRELPDQFNVADVIDGWKEGLQLMNPGSKYVFYIPYDLAYGSNGSKDAFGNIIIPPYTTLVFEIELIDILD